MFIIQTISVVKHIFIDSCTYVCVCVCVCVKVYIIKVTCTNGSTYYIYRRFKQFDEMHTALDKRFPIESGSINYKDRTLPNLPSKH